MRDHRFIDYLVIILCLTRQQKIPQTESYGFSNCSGIIFRLPFDAPNYLSRHFFYTCRFLPLFADLLR